MDLITNYFISRSSSGWVVGLRKPVLTFRVPIELTNSASFERVALLGL
jgi:hypothetical protein